ncbi:hypothetical protein [Lentzea cavernae]|uniref:RDD family protein n=1 Tax=Lentzea cavernae TaxID=2020703 RepID=A0ABQ3MRN2_9PSEU|nr:hypothetical protein [Lentzea cavernae]GHH56017.1 hypothetical protein GCM10017774_73360 [Lentzea cavernae]
MGAAFGITYFIGMLVSAGVGRSRAGISQRGSLSLLTILMSLPWFLTQMATMFVWPIVLGVWLARGKPKSPWRAMNTGDGTVIIRRTESLNLPQQQR